MPTDKTTVKITTLQGVYTETTVDGQPESVTMQGLQAATAYRAQAFYDNDGLQSTSNIVSFNTLPAEQYTFGTPVYTRGSNGEHIVTWTYTSVYALTTAIMNDGHGNNWQGVIDSNNHTLTFTMEQGEWEPNTNYLCYVRVFDIYGIEGGSPSTTIVTNTYNALVTTFVSSTATTATVQVTKHMDSTPVSVWVDCWYPGSDPSTDPADETEFLADGSDTVTFTNLTENTQYTFRAGASIDLQTSVYGNAVQGSTQAGWESKYFTINIPGRLAANVTIMQDPQTPLNFEYSTDGGTTWNQWTASDNMFTQRISGGGSISIKGVNEWGLNYMQNNNPVITVNREYTVSGNLHSLVKGDNFSSVTAFDERYTSLFRGETNLTDASNLRITGDIGSIYRSRVLAWAFSGCTNLVNPPLFIGLNTIYGEGCLSMFENCVSLVSSANMDTLSTIDSSGMMNMYTGCVSIVTTPSLVNVTTLGNMALNGIFSYCTSLTAAPSLPSATTAGYHAFASAFAGCTNLVNGCDIRTVVTNNRYPNARAFENMYYGCTRLATVYCADLQENSEMSDNWLGDVSASGTVICPSKTALDQLPTGSPHGIPSGWTAVVQAP